MKSSMKLLLGTLMAASLLPGIALAGVAKPVDPAVQKSLIARVEAVGYTDVRNIIMDGELFVADAKKDGKQVHLFLSKNGVVQDVKDGAHQKGEPTKDDAKQGKQY